ncbi:hypothetical protein KCU61_g27, partial [Aureobasidium melanogenum]
MVSFGQLTRLGTASSSTFSRASTMSKANARILRAVLRRLWCTNIPNSAASSVMRHGSSRQMSYISVCLRLIL